MSYFTDVLKFQRKFWPEHVRAVPPTDGWEEVSLAAVEASLCHVQEEVAELAAAVERRDAVETLDAIVDAIYVLCGLAARLGLPLDQAWAMVHRANMKKVRGPGKRGSIDVVKPEGWQPPNLRALFPMDERGAPQTDEKTAAVLHGASRGSDEVTAQIRALADQIWADLPSKWRDYAQQKRKTN